MLQFSKMQGAGNDFVVIDARYGLPFDPAGHARAVCDRHFGIGADGIVALEASREADFKMSYWNADGSRSVCGNGMRCLVRYIYSLELLSPEQRMVVLETDKGLVTAEVIGKGDRIRVDMGSPVFDGPLIPVAASGEQLDREIVVDGNKMIISCVSMGNPHCVIFTSGIDYQDISTLGALLENHPFFPERTNVEFVEIVDPHQVKIRIWERGVGETLACGTGNCAVLAAGVRTNRITRQVQVSSPGGEFDAYWNPDDDHIYLTGPAQEVYQGRVDVEALLMSFLPRGLS